MIKRDKLIAMCNEFSVLFDLKEPIDTNLSDKELHAQIKEAVELLEQDDDLSEETIEGLRTMGLFKKNVEKEEPVITLESQINEATKLKELRDIAKVNPEFKVIRGTLTKFTKVPQMRMTMLSILKIKVSKKKPVEEIDLKKLNEEVLKDIGATPLKVVTEVKKVVEKAEPKSELITKKDIKKTEKPIVKVASSKTKKQLFFEEVQKAGEKGILMSEIKKCDWNTAKGTFYSDLKIYSQKNMMFVKDSIIFIKK